MAGRRIPHPISIRPPAANGAAGRKAVAQQSVVKVLRRLGGIPATKLSQSFRFGARGAVADRLGPGGAQQLAGLGGRLSGRIVTHDALENRPGLFGHLVSQVEPCEFQLPLGVSVAGQSALYETDGVGGPPQPRFLNGAVAVECSITAREFFGALLQIEAALGRQREERNAPRTIDLDLLLWGDAIIDEEGLTVPHPRMHERWFVLRPLADLAPDVRHPVLGLTAKELLDLLPRESCSQQ